MPKGKQGRTAMILLNEFGLNPKEETFCRFYTMNDELFGNGTMSYSVAYKYNLIEMDKGSEEYNKAYNICSVESCKLLRKPKIQKRVTQLLNEMLADDFVDSQLARAIKQDYKWDVKVRAIAEYNKLKGRIEEKMKLSADKSLTALLDAAAKARNNQN